MKSSRYVAECSVPESPSVWREWIEMKKLIREPPIP